MKIYLAGPMRGIKAYNHPAFDRAAAMLRAEGHEKVFSPSEHDRERWPFWDWANFIGHPETDGIELHMREIIRDDLDWIADNAEAIALLPGWENSRGARVEHELGIFLGLWIRKL